MLRVTFDTNVLPSLVAPAAKPSKCKDENDYLRLAISDGTILPCLVETVATLDGIQCGQKRDFIGSYRPVTTFNESDTPKGSVTYSFMVGPNPTQHPGSHPKLSKLLTDAVAMGFRFLRCTRVAEPVNPDIEPGWFLEDAHVSADERQNAFCECARAIEAHGCGIVHLKAVGLKYVTGADPWQKGIANAPNSADVTIIDAVREWADADAIAAHVAYQNDYFCTKDFAKNAGANSILAPAHRKWLTATYGVQFVTPEELCDLLKT